MMYGHSKTEPREKETVCHIVDTLRTLLDIGHGSFIWSLCGVRLTVVMSSMVGWNLCQRCEKAAKKLIEAD